MAQPSSTRRSAHSSDSLRPRTSRRFHSFVSKLKSSIQQCEWSRKEVMNLLLEALEVPFDPEAEIDEPSALTSRQYWKPFQFNPMNRPRWIAYRGPPEAEPSIPLVLLHKSFADFCSQANAPSCLGLNDADYDMASFMWDEFSKGYDDEKSDMTGPLNGKFRRYLGENITLSPGRGYVHTDGMLFHQNSDGKATFEDKSEGADAFFQVLEYERKAFRENVSTGMKRLSHGLAVLRTCPYIQFVAVVMDWESRDEDDIRGRILGEPLTHQINCFGPKETGIDTLCKALKALKCFSSQYTAETFIDVSRPYQLHDWTDLRRISEHRLVFLGTFEGSTRVAKFTSSYSLEAHKAWAQAGVASRIDKVEELSSGWKFVVMEYLSDADNWILASTLIDRYKGNANVLKHLQEAMRVAVCRGHQSGYVHGDARPENMFVKEAHFEIRLIDFDWSGQTNVAVYPHRLNPKIHWHQDAGYGKLIKEEHDFVFLDRLVS